MVASRGGSSCAFRLAASIAIFEVQGILIIGCTLTRQPQACAVLVFCWIKIKSTQAFAAQSCLECFGFRANVEPADERLSVVGQEVHDCSINRRDTNV